MAHFRINGLPVLATIGLVDGQAMSNRTGVIAFLQQLYWDRSGYAPVWIELRMRHLTNQPGQSAFGQNGLRERISHLIQIVPVTLLPTLRPFEQVSHLFVDVFQLPLQSVQCDLSIDWVRQTVADSVRPVDQ